MLYIQYSYHLKLKIKILKIHLQELNVHSRNLTPYLSLTCCLCLPKTPQQLSVIQ